MRLRTAIRMIFALELHHKPFPDKASFVKKESARRRFFTCYMMDRFSVCGSKRPMFITNKSLSFRLPSTDESISQNGETTSCFFQELAVRQAGREQSDNVISTALDITRILGKANDYLQRGGLRGDSHFPWHPTSNLPSMVNELKTWELRISSITLNSIDLSNKRTTGCWFLSWFIYHVTHVRIHRPFLPVAISASRFESGSGNHT